jgi:hypothetical protein
VIIQLPDGKTAEFPDGMAPADIEAAIGQQFPAQQARPQAGPQAGPAASPAPTPAPAASWLPQSIQYPINQLTKGLAAGVDLLGEPITRLAADPAYSRAPAKTTIANVTAPYQPFPGVAPTGPIDRYAGAIAGGAGTAIPMGLLGGPLATAIAGGAGGAASEAVHENLPGHPGLEVAAGAAPGLVMGAAAPMIGHSELGAVAEGLGQSKTLQQAGEHLQAGLQSWLTKDLPAQEESVWAPVDAAMHPETVPGETSVGPSVGLANTEAALKALTREGADDAREAGLAKVTQPRLASQLLAALRGEDQVAPGAKLPAGLKAINAPSPAGGPIEPLGWDVARGLRSTLGAAMTDSASPLFKDLGQKNLSSLYGALTKDLQATA